MNRETWLTSAQPEPMIEFIDNVALVTTPQGKRKLRLYVAGLLRQCWVQLDPRVRFFHETAEAYADKEVPKKKLVWSFFECGRVLRGKGKGAKVWRDALVDSPREPALHPPPWLDLSPAVRADLLRAVIGDPWTPWLREDEKGIFSWATPYVEIYKHVRRAKHRSPEIFRHGWLTPAVRNLAEVIFRDRDWSALPILADALEDAGCSHDGLLGHLRNNWKGLVPVRGLWSLDLVLGR